MRDEPHRLLLARPANVQNERQKRRLTGIDAPRSTEAAARSGRSLARRPASSPPSPSSRGCSGLVREQVFAALLGAGLYADAFQVAFRIPNLLRDLFAEGALSAAFVPDLRPGAGRGRPRAGPPAGLAPAHACWRSCSACWSCSASSSRGPLVAPAGPRLRAVPGKVELTVLLTRIMLPFLPLVSFAAVAMGMLNAEGRFGMPAARARDVQRGLDRLGRRALWAMGFGPAQVALGWAVGTLLGGAAQFLIQVPPLLARRAGASGRNGRPGDPGHARASARSWRRPPWAWPRCRSTSS